MTTRYDQISTNLTIVREQIINAAIACRRKPEAITLIVVTKNFPVSDCEILYQLGEREFGENRDQEGRLKSEALPSDIGWHFQGQIQSNKINSIVSWATTIHSLTEFSHAQRINSLKSSADKEKVFIQINFDDDANEEANASPSRNRGGVKPGLLTDLLVQIHPLSNLEVVGLMTVAPLNHPSKFAFERLFNVQQELVRNYPTISQLSFGMSNDFESAIACGATHLRIGSSILGERLTLN
jgi:pyridoxal phosphate enzyme (YggS family)